MGDLEFFIPGGDGIRMGDEGNQHFKWTFCDVCNKPRDQVNGTLTSRDGVPILWTCDQCKDQGFNV
jgi:RNase P subunit RPR2